MKNDSATTRKYWRSLEQLNGGPAYGEIAGREFPEGASEIPEGITRRDMLMLLGASLSMAGLAGCRRPVEAIVPYVAAPEQVIPGVPMHYATTMPFGTSAYGLVVESHEGRPSKIEGNSLHPASGGASSAWIQASLYDLYDPDRSRSVLHDGEKATWEEFAAAFGSIRGGAGDGSGIAVLTESFHSPTLARLRSAFLAAHPGARWVVWEPAGEENVCRGLETATGTALQPVYHLDRAEIIVSVDADLLGTHPESVRHARGFADGRRLGASSDSMNRLYVVESSFTVTGAAADHRKRLQSGRMAAFVAALASELASRGLPTEVAENGSTAESLGLDAKWLRAVARELVANRGGSVIVAGSDQPAGVHAAVAELNRRLGNVGSTVTYGALEDAGLPDTPGLTALAEEMRAGSIGTLIVLGGNPVYNAPADLDFAGAMAGVGTTIHLSGHVNETSRVAGWHLPEAHYLESWSDSRSVEGVPSVVQPLIAPLFGGRSKIELLSLVATGAETSGYDLVRETWISILAGRDFEKGWHRVLHDGLLDGDPPATDPEIDGAAVAAALQAAVSGSRVASAGDLEIRFAPSMAVHDGRFANNGWLQELPDPATKITWDNAAIVSQATARERGLARGDVARLSYGDRTLEMPVFVLPGQADHTVTVALGYGRRDAGRVGNGVGVDAYALRSSAAPGFDTGLTLEPAGRTHRLATTQDHWVVDDLGVEERARRVGTLYREGTLDEYRHHPEFAKHATEGPHPPLESLWHEKAYDDGNQWGMAIDLNACIGCNACVIACQSENNIAVVGRDQVSRGREMHWIRIDRYFKGDPDDPQQMVFQPVTCMHCENAPCEQVCPVAATVHDEEGLNTMVYNRCIGTRYCSNNCPYKVRRFNFYNFTKDTPDTLKMAYNPDVTVRSRGVMEKCTFCTQRINAARIDAKMDGREIRDGDVRTACQQACPTQAIEFGNLLDGASAVAGRKRLDRSYVMLEELNNKPRTTYQARIRNPNPELTDA
jgi:molybdopterin-containing oxidoreductase family iron-sulfur binding subunit